MIAMSSISLSAADAGRLPGDVVGMGILTGNVGGAHHVAVVAAGQSLVRVGLQRNHQVGGDVVADRRRRIPVEPDHRVFILGILRLQDLADVALGGRVGFHGVGDEVDLLVGGDRDAEGDVLDDVGRRRQERRAAAVEDLPAVVGVDRDLRQVPQRQRIVTVGRRVPPIRSPRSTRAWRQ